MREKELEKTAEKRKSNNNNILKKKMVKIKAIFI